LPLSVEVCTPVSETGSAGALPGAAANIQLHCVSTNKEQTPGKFYERHIEQDDRVGAEPQLAGD
jgi:hypothetical protein